MFFYFKNPITNVNQFLNKVSEYMVNANKLQKLDIEPEEKIRLINSQNELYNELSLFYKELYEYNKLNGEDENFVRIDIFKAFMITLNQSAQVENMESDLLGVTTSTESVKLEPKKIDIKDAERYVERVHHLMKKRGIKINDLADELNVHRATLSSVLNGKRNISKSLQGSLIEYFGDDYIGIKTKEKNK